MFLFNDVLNTFYLRLYGVRHMVKDLADSESGNPLPPHGLFFPINSKGILLHASSHTSRGEIAQLVHHMKDRSDAQLDHERMLLPRSYISLLKTNVNFVVNVKLR